MKNAAAYHECHARCRVVELGPVMLEGETVQVLRDGPLFVAVEPATMEKTLWLFSRKPKVGETVRGMWGRFAHLDLTFRGDEVMPEWRS